MEEAVDPVESPPLVQAALVVQVEDGFEEAGA
jgi:hypothetical protein